MTTMNGGSDQAIFDTPSRVGDTASRPVDPSTTPRWVTTRLSKWLPNATIAPNDTTDTIRSVVSAPSPIASTNAAMIGRPGGKIVSGWSASIRRPCDPATVMPVDR